MKSIFVKKENWLLITPLLFAFVERIFNNTGTLDFHLHDTYFVIASFHWWLFFLLINLVPFACHSLLRYRNVKNKVLSAVHVLLTILCCTVIFISFKIEAGVPTRYYDFAGWESNASPASVYDYAAVAVLLLFSIHLMLFIYTGYALVRGAVTKG